MLDIQLLRSNLALVAERLATRGVQLDTATFEALEAERKAVQSVTENLQAKRNSLSKQVGMLKSKGEDASAVLAEVAGIPDELKANEVKLAALQERYNAFVAGIPNLPHDSVPVGQDESGNVEVLRWGTPRSFDFEVKDHVDVGTPLGLDFETATKITGSRFTLMKGNLARLHRALAQFMLDTHTQEHGYTELYAPYLVNAESMFGTGQLPKFEEDQYGVPRDDLFLIPTAEVPVTNLHRDEILEESQLPVQYTAYTPCFRREAGSYGKETKGLIRIHQFDKVELVKFTTPESSYAEHEKLVQQAETILQRLGLHYRVVALASGDLGFSAAKCYDLEAWAPGTGQYLEVSSCSNFEDFQARRANIRYRQAATKKLAFVHTLNGSGVALARTFVCVLEQYQQPDGRILIPEVLRPYLNGQTHL